MRFYLSPARMGSIKNTDNNVDGDAGKGTPRSPLAGMQTSASPYGNQQYVCN